MERILRLYLLALRSRPPFVFVVGQESYLMLHWTKAVNAHAGLCLAAAARHLASSMWELMIFEVCLHLSCCDGGLAGLQAAG